MLGGYLFYASLSLFGMGCLTIVLALIFLSKNHEIEKNSKNLSANIFNKTFCIFDPYPEPRKSIYSHLSILLLACFLFIIFSAIMVWKILETGLLLSLTLIIIGLNLMLIDVALEVYKNVKSFTNAIRHKSNVGVGDLTVLQTLKNSTSKLSIYYFSISLIFFILGSTLQYLLPPLLWFLAEFIGLILEISAWTGVVAYQVAVFLFSIMIVITQRLTSRIKHKILRRIGI